MELLVRVAETGSMTLAATQLHLTPAAVSAAVQRIESAVGVRIFERTTRSLHLTDEGAIVIDGCQDVLSRWQQTLDDAREGRRDLEGTVHLSAPTDTTYQLLESVVVEVCAAHPNLRVVLDASDRVKHLHEQAIDLAIRYGTLSDSTLAARKLAESPGILVAAPTYLERSGVPQTLADLSEHRCLTLHLSNTPSVTWKLQRDGTWETFTLQSPLCGDGYLARRWAIAGMGIAYKGLVDVIGDLEAGRLVRVLPSYTGKLIGVHAVFPSRSFLPARVRVLDAAISSRFEVLAARCASWLNESGEPGAMGC